MVWQCFTPYYLLLLLFPLLNLYCNGFYQEFFKCVLFKKREKRRENSNTVVWENVVLFTGENLGGMGDGGIRIFFF